MWRKTSVALLCAAWLVSPVTAQQRSNADYSRIARSAAPNDIASAATIARFDSAGSLTVLHRGTNTFTCFVGIPGDPNVPVCGDEPAMQWLKDMVAGAPAPTNKTPGIAYMAKGGIHFETSDGRIVMESGPHTRVHQEPPHWMILWPFDPSTTGLSTFENEGGTYIMFANTPYAHLMVYQDPVKLKVRRAT